MPGTAGCLGPRLVKIYLGLSPLTRPGIWYLLVGDSYKPSSATGWGVDPTTICHWYHTSIAEVFQNMCWRATRGRNTHCSHILPCQKPIPISILRENWCALFSRPHLWHGSKKCSWFLSTTKIEKAAPRNLHLQEGDTINRADSWLASGWNPLPGSIGKSCPLPVALSFLGKAPRSLPKCLDCILSCCANLDLNLYVTIYIKFGIMDVYGHFWNMEEQTV